MTILAFFGFPGHIEVLIIAFVILLLFGHRLPSLMRSLGRGVVEFKHGLHGVEDDFDDVSDSKEDKKIDDKVSDPVSEK